MSQALASSEAFTESHSRHTSLKQKGDGRRHASRKDFPVQVAWLWPPGCGSSCQFGSAHAVPYKPRGPAISVCPNWDLNTRHLISILTLLPTCSTLWMISLVSLTLPKLQTVLCSLWQGAESLYIIQVYFHHRDVYTTSQNGTHRLSNIPGIATSKRLAEDPQTWVCSPTQLHPTALLAGNSFK